MGTWYIIINVLMFLSFPHVDNVGTRQAVSVDDGAVLTALQGEPAQHRKIMYAQNDKTIRSDSDTAEGADGPDKEASEGKPSQKDRNARKNGEPLKPFVPSEKIPADQAVDFPYDI